MKLVEPKVKTDSIQIEFEPDKPKEADDFIKTFSNYIPIIKLQDEIIETADILMFSYSVEYNTIPTFVLKINDSTYRYRNKLNDVDIIKGTCFVGNKYWYHKNNLYINNVDIINDTLFITGIFYNEKLYENTQLSFKDKSLKDILIEFCTNTDLGLVTDESKRINKVNKFVFNTGLKPIDFIPKLISQQTTKNFWCIDNYYILHIQDYDTLINKDVDKFSIFFNQKLDEPIPITITNWRLNEDSNQLEQYKLLASDVKVTNNLGTTNLKFSKDYSLTEHNVNSYDGVGTGEIVANTFSRFKQFVTPFYDEILSKELSGNIFELTLTFPIFEIFPFMVVNTEIYRLADDKVGMVMNEKQSGKRIVLGYTLIYNSRTGDNSPSIKQKIKLI